MTALLCERAAGICVALACLFGVLAILAERRGVR